MRGTLSKCSTPLTALQMFIFTSCEQVCSFHYNVPAVAQVAICFFAAFIGILPFWAKINERNVSTNTNCDRYDCV